ncbi:MAG: hypothetical protein ACRCVW_04320 [Brevinema sp.]
MLVQILFLLIVNISLFASEEDTIIQDFQALREKHLGVVAAKAFSAELEPADAKRLLGDKIKGKYRVEVNYAANKGVELLVKDTETFYEMALSQYASYINMLLLPLMSTVGYERLQQRFTIKKSIKKDITYYVSYKRGDIETVYVMKVGNLGLVDTVMIVEDQKKKFVAEILWLKQDHLYVPQKIKTINYEGTRSTGIFQIYKIILK